MVSRGTAIVVVLGGLVAVLLSGLRERFGFDVQLAGQQLQEAATTTSSELTTEAAVARTSSAVSQASADAFDRTGEHTFRQGAPEIGDTGDPVSAAADLVAGSARVSRGEVGSNPPDPVAQLEHDIQVAGSPPSSPSEAADLAAIEALKTSQV